MDENRSLALISSDETSRVVLHENEVAIDETVARSLLESQCPQWAGLPLSPAGAGTDNIMFRLGNELLVRLPRTADKARSLQKEQQWLPRLAPLLSCPIPEPFYAGTPTRAFPLEWSVYRWIDGEAAAPDTVRDWATLGTDVAEFVRELRGVNLMDAIRTGDLRSYRGNRLQGGPKQAQVRMAKENFDRCRTLIGSQLDLDALEQMWLAALALPEPAEPHVWLHGDLKPANLLVRNGKLHAIIDFGSLSVGFPEGEHTTQWEMPPQARLAYRNALDIDDQTWARVRARAIAGSLVGILYYWHAWPSFAAQSQAHLQAILTEAAVS
jgi:aminoglycoside phosphotransferase (APT) family kinase protein